MTAISPAPPDASAPVQAVLRPAPAHRLPVAEGLAFAGLLDGLSTAHPTAQTAEESSSRAHTPLDSRRREGPDGQPELQTESADSGLSLLFAAPFVSAALPDASAAPALNAANAANAPAAASEPSPAAAPPPAGETAVARLVGARSFVLPAKSDAASAMSAANASAGASWTELAATGDPAAAPSVEAQAPLLPSAAQSLAPQSVNSNEAQGASSTAPGSDGKGQAAPAEPVSAGVRAREPSAARTPPVAASNGARLPPPSGASPESLARSATDPNGSAKEREGDPNGSASGDPATNASPGAALTLNASSVPGGFLQNGPDIGAPSAVNAPTPPAASAAAAPPRAPVREIDLDLSPGGLEDVSMTMRLQGDRLSVVIRAASPRTAGAIEGAREAIAERLAAIGQPLGSFVIQQTGAADGTGKAANTRRDDGGQQAQSQDQGDPRGGPRRDPGGFSRR